jgi:hypothetical protein
VSEGKVGDVRIKILISGNDLSKVNVVHIQQGHVL